MKALELTAAAPAPVFVPVPACDTAIPADCDPRIATVFRYWQRRQPASGVLPGRQHVWPADLSDLLRHVWLCDVQREPLRFRYRLLGTMIAHVVGRDQTGEWLDEVHENFTASAAYADFVSAIETGAGVYYKGRPLFHLDKDYVGMERLLLPLARNGRDVDMILGITLYGALASSSEAVGQRKTASSSEAVGQRESASSSEAIGQRY